MSLVVNDVSYIFPDREVLFEHISFSVSAGQKASLIGNNGSGKSTLLKVVAGKLRPWSGDVSAGGSLYYVPQHYGQYDETTVAGALGVADKLAALAAILSGDCAEDHYTVLDDDWEIEERVTESLGHWKLRNMGPHTPMRSLSGGEKTKVFLAGIAVHNPDLVLMDEPTNHLDREARELLYELIRESPLTVLFVSHDRRMLDLADVTFDLDRGGITRYGGNYDFYREQFDIQLGALQDRIADKQKELASERKKAREVAERKQKEDARGEKKQKKAGVPRIMMNSLRDGAEKSATKLQDKHQRIMEDTAREVRQLRAEVPDLHGFRISLENSTLHRGKMLIEAKDLQFAYGESGPLWEEPLELRIASGDRVVIYGPNGSGKTTLLKLLRGELTPTAGTLVRADFSSIYIDQEYSLVDDGSTILAQVEKFNRLNLPPDRIRTELHRFLFPAQTWDRPCAALSGGEKMRLTLCGLLISNELPDMIILDEPTNNLDIRSMEILTGAIRSYRGTLVVISHDTRFLEDIGVERRIDLNARL